jgi:hypothetical protein
MGNGIGEGKHFPLQIAHGAGRAAGSHQQQGVVDGVAVDLGGDQKLHVKIAHAGHVGAGTDKSQVDLPLGNQVVDFHVGAPLHQFNRPLQFLLQVVEQGAVAVDGAFGGDDGGHGHAQGSLRYGWL